MRLLRSLLVSNLEVGAEYVSDHNQVGLNVVHCETEHGQVLAGKKIKTLTIFGQKTSVQMTLDILVLEIEFCLKEAHLGEEGLGVPVHDVRVVLLQKTVHFLHLGICKLSRDISDFQNSPLQL